MRLIDADALKENMKFSGGMRDDDWILNVPYREVNKNIDDAPTVLGWISVKDRLPESKPEDLEYPIVIIASKDGTVELGCYYESTKEWGAGENYDRSRHPVAWMPLPEPPK